MQPIQAITSCNKCPMLPQGATKCSIDGEVIPADSLAIDEECIKLTALFTPEELVAASSIQTTLEKVPVAV